MGSKKVLKGVKRMWNRFVLQLRIRFPKVFGWFQMRVWFAQIKKLVSALRKKDKKFVQCPQCDVPFVNDDYERVVKCSNCGWEAPDESETDEKMSWFYRIPCWFGYHDWGYQDRKTGVYLHTVPYNWTGRKKCWTCNRIEEEKI